MDSDLAFLKRQFETGNIVLFAGAGFSVGANNRRGQSPPTGGELAKLLLAECGWPAAEDPLTDVYEQAQKHLGAARLQSVLESHYLHCKPADWHRLIPPMCWHRIYTTNIDDVLQQAYHQQPGQQTLRTVVSPAPVIEGDPFLESVQCVHLHGAVADPSKPLTFTLEDFAKATATPNPWYQALVDDMSSKSMLFIGTRLQDPPFYHYLELRSLRLGGRESRARAFLVAASLSPVRRRTLQSRNITPIEDNAANFLRKLLAVFDGAPPQRTTILHVRYPHQLRALESGDVATTRILRQFDFITASSLPGTTGAHRRSMLYMGAEPTWSDIAGSLDAFRTCTRSFIDTLLTQDGCASVVVLTGYAGSGKTATMMRAACELSRRGETVYYYKDLEKPNVADLSSFLLTLNDRKVYLFFDRATQYLDQIDALQHGLPELSRVVFVLADRSHVIVPRLSKRPELRARQISMPVLDREDIILILDRLEQTGFLGKLQGLSREQQIRAFEVLAEKQVLVALREATFGKGFDAILHDEFAGLASYEAKLAYTIVSLAALHASRGVRRRHLLACIDGSDEEKARVLTESLKEVVVPVAAEGNLLATRHRLIGQFVAEVTAPLELKREAVTRFLIQVSGDITPNTIRRRFPEYVAYRGLINFDGLCALFGKDYDILVEIYETVRPYYSDDFLFWLQYGRTELEFDHFDLAEKSLNQSLAIRPESHQTLHHQGVLYLKRAYSGASSSNAEEDAAEGEGLLLDQIQSRGKEDPYPYAACLHHKHEYLKRMRPVGYKAELEQLRRLASESLHYHPGDTMLKREAEEIERDYLMLAVSRP